MTIGISQPDQLSNVDEDIVGRCTVVAGSLEPATHRVIWPVYSESTFWSATQLLGIGAAFQVAGPPGFVACPRAIPGSTIVELSELSPGQIESCNCPTVIKSDASFCVCCEL